MSWVMECISEWETLYLRAKDKGITLDETVKAFKLLMTTNLDELDLKLVLSEVDMKSEDGKKRLFDQTKMAIRKYHSAGSSLINLCRRLYSQNLSGARLKTPSLPRVG